MNAQAEPDASEYDAPFWREKLCAALGISPKLDDAYIKSALAKHLSWRGQAAHAIGVSPNLSDRDLLEAHAKHMDQVRKVNSAATIQNEGIRRNKAVSLINTLVARGITYDAAFLSVRATYPKLFLQ